MTIHRIGLATILVAAISLSSTDAAAQGYWPDASFSPRLYLGGQLGYNHILTGSMFFSEEGLEGVPADGQRVHLTRSGFGWSLYLGLRFSPYVAAEIAWDALYHPSVESSTCNYAIIEGVRGAVRVHFPRGYNLEPFLRLGLGWYFYGDEFQADEDGLGYSLGLGANYQIAHWMELEMMLLYRAFYFKGMKIASDGSARCGGGYCPFGDQYIHSVNLTVGFHWNAWIFGW